MKRAVELMAMHLMQQLHATSPLPAQIQPAFLAMDRVFPTWRVPQSNLANPPRIDPVNERHLNGTLTYRCPVCQVEQTTHVTTEADLSGLATDLLQYRGAGVCAHDANGAIKTVKPS